MSCKALDPSQHEIEFRAFCEMLNNSFARCLIRGAAVHVSMVLGAARSSADMDPIAMGEAVAALAKPGRG